MAIKTPAKLEYVNRACIAGLPYMVSELLQLQLQHCTLSILTIIVKKSDGDSYCYVSVMERR